ncbi:MULTISPECIES: UDP-3-O-acyl-N-acetylglucosamine deacetylase [Methylobacterium]|jgi:UDP-3-O-[3-hydroxymyristoyl] N-acetylglucosamine deacetylase|uniref:UDP-3-O-acyl-N-acetylglucosamine deacetylase n=1 Tax=Methylobacterium bullatum TaxID=570505 RepID=A0A679K3M9_9HYPH|nr:MULTISPECIES: UDP-3-O-acyl-N-acetylglucosamine deacetylase [unclassified Methylobacterium]KQO43491.1 UDP-3-O-[3-hydroxymyristoyl] N-acetylglucosamine deacetylase [Methylobacterium sp. Leaf85]KQP47299.1 UDP-3-O-[3-hydroxymyristoyl] N-acetylglucosamine deacetylase [Methylobacterium sp. Leaf106]TXN24767.1 UDP-3-O-acyl-N-acetylglucosamine deacetylase [Methylobacterium sp. WL19]CAA2144036.1 UDP-3-O-acyl-N-acetylglucosamine deacetylase [Methylobacterium bullatum]
MRTNQQITLKGPATLRGIGVHSGKPVEITLHPAAANHGICFLRTGMPTGHDRLIKAHHACVSATELCTVIGDVESGAVATIEHLMSALFGLGIDNVLVEIDGPEMPILDGSARLYVEAIDAVGIATCGAPRRWIKVLRTVRIEVGRAFAELRPIDRGFRLDVEIDFDNPVIGRSRKAMDLNPASYRREIAGARTFGMMKDVERYWKAGFALGASLENTVAVGDNAVVNPEGLRYADEFVRHKYLDAVGDLALAGLPIQGAYRSYCGGHRMNVGVLDALFADRANYTIVEAPGARRETTRPEFGVGLSLAAFASDL